MPVPQHNAVIVWSEEMEVNIHTFLTPAFDVCINYVDCHLFSEVLISG
jgi:hypothetical protein